MYCVQDSKVLDGKIEKVITIALKSMLELLTLQGLVLKFCEMQNI